jgi:transposase-like protein
MMPSTEVSMSKQRKQDRGRFSAKRKVATVIRLLKGEDLDTLSRELGVTAAKLSEWRDDFLAGGEAGLKSREPSAVDDENQRLKAKLGELLMDNELLRVRAGIDPFPWGKSRG